MKRYYLLGTDGTLRFTAVGRTILQPIFSKHGIDIAKIGTRQAYIEARLKVRPWFLSDKWLNETPDHSTQTDDASADHKLLMEAVFGNHTPEQFQSMIAKVKKRALFSVIDGDR